jgi:hypothetical protein
MVHSKTWLTPLPDDNFEIRTLLEEHNNRVLKKEFNPASGLLPLVNLGGTGLYNFINRPSIGQFSGPVRIVKLLPELSGQELKRALEETDSKATLCISIADRSGSATVLVATKARTTLLRLLLGKNLSKSTWRAELFFNQVFEATIRSVIWNKERYFVAINLAETRSYTT